MMRLWEWYRARRWWVKTLIAAPLALVAIVLLYVAVRGLQYATAGGDAREYTPAGANFACGVRDLGGEWESIQKSDAWKSLRKKAQKDRAFRAAVGDLLKDAGLPTLDQLDDRRWMAEHPEYEESNILRLGGRDALYAVRVADDFAKARFLAATKVRFGDYLLLPFAKPAAGLFGAKKEEIGGWSCLSVTKGKAQTFIAIDDAYVIASDDRGLLADGLRKKGKKPKLARPFWMRADFGSSPALAKWRKKFRGVPAGALFAFVNAETARSMEIEAGWKGSSVLADVRLDGAQVKEVALDPALAAFTPADATGCVIESAGMSDLYAWIKTLVVPDPKASQFDKYVQQQAFDAVKELEKAGFEREFLPRAGAPMAVVLGSEVGSGGNTYTSLAFVVKCPDARSALDALRGVLERLLKDFQRPTTELRSGGTLVYFDRKSDPFGYNDYLRPCAAELGDVLIVGNNLQFVRRVLETGAGEGARFPDETSQRQGRQRMKEMGFEAPGAAGDCGGGVLVLSALQQGLMGHIPEIATKTVDSTSPKAQIRREIENQLRKEGRDPRQMMLEVDRMVVARREELVEEQRRKTEGALRPLDAAKWIAFGARAQGEVVTLRVMAEIR
ncbi:MAG: hypothetical protein HYY17_07660 [Planctomycetes bacterium]|nr:hypothetical protein [Planctomycetota bacterium]